MNLCVRISVTVGALALASVASGQVFTLRSGQVGGLPGAPGQPDDIATWGGAFFGPGPYNSGGAFTAADFNNTVANPAVVVQPHPSWIPGLTADPLARWIGTRLYPGLLLGDSSSTLYRIPFTVSATGITAAFLSISWSSDDSLGDLAFGGPNPVGAYLRDPFGNVTPLVPVSGGNFTIESTVLTMNILGAVNTGLNELFFYQRDQGGAPSGLIFSALFEIVPAPSTAALLGLAGLAATRRRR